MESFARVQLDISTSISSEFIFLVKGVYLLGLSYNKRLPNIGTAETVDLLDHPEVNYHVCAVWVGSDPNCAATNTTTPCSAKLCLHLSQTLPQPNCMNISYIQQHATLWLKTTKGAITNTDKDWRRTSTIDSKCGHSAMKRPHRKCLEADWTALPSHNNRHVLCNCHIRAILGYWNRKCILNPRPAPKAGVPDTVDNSLTVSSMPVLITSVSPL